MLCCVMPALKFEIGLSAFGYLDLFSVSLLKRRAYIRLPPLPLCTLLAASLSPLFLSDYSSSQPMLRLTSMM